MSELALAGMRFALLGDCKDMVLNNSPDRGHVGMKKFVMCTLSFFLMVVFVDFIAFSPMTSAGIFKTKAYQRGLSASVGKSVQQGSFVGRSIQQGNTKKIYDRSGRMAGRSVQQGNTIRAFSRSGKIVGKIRRR